MVYQFEFWMFGRQYLSIISYTEIQNGKQTDDQLDSLSECTGESYDNDDSEFDSDDSLGEEEVDDDEDDDEDEDEDEDIDEDSVDMDDGLVNR